MARIRSTKPEFWSDEDLATGASRDARLLYMGLWNLADEHARLRGDPRYIKGQLFAYDDDLTPAAVDLLLDELARLGKAQRYRVGGGRYIFLPKLGAHQRLEPDKTPSRLPAPEDGDIDPPPPLHRRSENVPDESEKIPEESAQKRTVEDDRSVAGANTTAEQPRSEIPDLSAQIPEESALARARFGSMEHVARGFPPGAGVAPSARTPSLALVLVEDETLSGELLPPAGPPQPENAGQLNRQWIDHCKTRNLKLTTTHIKRYGAGIKKALDDGFTVDIVKRALAEMLADRVASRPGLLNNYLVRVQQGPELPPRRATPGEASVIRMSPPGEDVGALIHDALTRPA
jgi:hypothetical protein